MRQRRLTKAQIEKKRLKEQETVETMIHLYCRGMHHSERLCEECSELLEYARRRSDRCSFMENKTFCSNCEVHCYKPAMRERIRTVMRYSGPRMMFRHPIMTIKHMYYSFIEKRRLKANRGQ